MKQEIYTDDDVRRLLAARNRGASIADAGAVIGRSKGSAIGFLHRCNKEADAIPCECRKPENKDGAGWTWA